MKEKHQHAAGLLFPMSPLRASDPHLKSHRGFKTAQVWSEIMQQHRWLLRDDMCTAVLPVHDRKWHPSFHIKANEHVMCGKGQASKPGDRCYMWTNNYVAATGNKGNFNVCQTSAYQHPPPLTQKCQVFGRDTSRCNCFLVLFSILQRILDTTWQKTKIDFILFRSYWITVTGIWEGSCWGSVPTCNILANVDVLTNK